MKPLLISLVLLAGCQFVGRDHAAYEASEAKKHLLVLYDTAFFHRDTASMKIISAEMRSIDSMIVNITTAK